MNLIDIQEQQIDELDHSSFEIKHSISKSHLNLEVIKNVIADLPVHQIAYASDSRELQADFEKNPK